VDWQTNKLQTPCYAEGPIRENSPWSRQINNPYWIRTNLQCSLPTEWCMCYSRLLLCSWMMVDGVRYILTEVWNNSKYGPFWYPRSLPHIANNHPPQLLILSSGSCITESHSKKTGNLKAYLSEWHVRGTPLAVGMIHDWITAGAWDDRTILRWKTPTCEVNKMLVSQVVLCGITLVPHADHLVTNSLPLAVSNIMMQLCHLAAKWKTFSSVDIYWPHRLKLH